MPVPTALPPSPSSRRVSDASCRKLLRLFNGHAVGRELLPQAHGNRVLHVGAAGLHDVVNCLAFSREGRGQLVEHGVELFERQQRGQPHGGGEDIVGGLPVVHVIVGVDVGVFAELASQDLVGAVGDDLIGVHVQADARAGLENIDDEFAVPFTVDDFLGGLDDGVGTFLIHQAEFFVGFRGGTLDHAQGADKRR